MTGLIQNPAIELTDDERDLILQMRKSANGGSPSYVGDDKESGVFITLIKARAELYIHAIRGDRMDLHHQYGLFHQMLSPYTVIHLCDGWRKYRDHLRDEEFKELESA